MRIAFPILIVAALILYSCEGLITGGHHCVSSRRPPARPQPQPDIKPADVKIFICPQDDCAGKLADIINSSSNAACALYALTEPRVLASVQDKAVPLVLDQSVADKKVKFEDAIFGPEGHTMHDKFCIIDGEEVITGSHNPTRNKIMTSSSLSAQVQSLRSTRMSISRCEAIFSEEASRQRQSPSQQKGLHHSPLLPRRPLRRDRQGSAR